MKCPSCKFEQADDRLDCECCGLIFAKWKERHSPPSPTEEAPVPATEEVSQGNSPLPDPPQATDFPPEDPLPSEASIPSRPPEEAPPEGKPRRLYGYIAALDFQKTLDGDWIYFPWGMFGRGYRLKSLELKNEIEQFLTLFCCVHSPMAALLGFSALLTWFCQRENPYEGLVFLTFYLLVAYLFLWIKTRQWTTQLTRSTNRMNSSYYYYFFFKALNLKSLLTLEVLFLITTLGCVWLWLTEKWRWLMDMEDFSVLWVALAISGILLGWFSYRNYFKKNR